MLATIPVVDNLTEDSDKEKPVALIGSPSITAALCFLEDFSKFVEELSPDFVPPPPPRPSFSSSSSSSFLLPPCLTPSHFSLLLFSPFPLFCIWLPLR